MFLLIYYILIMIQIKLPASYERKTYTPKTTKSEDYCRKWIWSILRSVYSYMTQYQMCLIMDKHMPLYSKSITFFIVFFSVVFSSISSKYLSFYLVNMCAANLLLWYWIAIWYKRWSCFMLMNKHNEKNIFVSYTKKNLIFKNISVKSQHK